MTFGSIKNKLKTDPFKSKRLILEKALKNTLTVQFHYTNQQGLKAVKCCEITEVSPHFFKAIEQGKAEPYDYLLSRVTRLRIGKSS